LCIVGFFFGIEFIRQGEREKEKKNVRRRREKKEEGDEHSVEQFCLHQ
jgi:hypothetical protein